MHTPCNCKLTNIDNSDLLSFQKPEHGCEILQQLRFDDRVPVVAAHLTRAGYALYQLHQNQAILKIGLKVVDLRLGFTEMSAKGVVDPVRERGLLKKLPIFVHPSRHFFSGAHPVSATPGFFCMSGYGYAHARNTLHARRPQVWRKIYLVTFKAFRLYY